MLPAYCINMDGKYATGGNIVYAYIGELIGKVGEPIVVRKYGEAVAAILHFTNDPGKNSGGGQVQAIYKL